MSHDIETQLRDYTDNIVERIDVDSLLERDVVTARSRRGRAPMRGVLVAAATALTVLVLASPSFLSRPDDTVETRPVVTTPNVSELVPRPLPDVDSWEWTRIDGTFEDLPTGPFFASGSQLFALEYPCIAYAYGQDCSTSEFWWVSMDGYAWTPEPVDPNLAGYSLFPLNTPIGVWLTGNDDLGARSMFSPRGDSWSRIGIELGPDLDVFVGMANNTLLVATDRHISVSADMGLSFETFASPWSSGVTMALLSTSDGFVAYIWDEGEIYTWTSENGQDWTPIELSTPLADGPIDQLPAPIDEVPPPVTDEADGSIRGLSIVGHTNRFIARIDTDERSLLWLSDDGLTWTRLQDLESRVERGFASVHTTDFGFLAWAKAPGDDQRVVVLVSSDGVEWHGVPDLQVPGEIPTTLSASEADGRLFVLVTQAERRILWVGGFPNRD